MDGKTQTRIIPPIIGLIILAIFLKFLIYKLTVRLSSRLEGKIQIQKQNSVEEQEEPGFLTAIQSWLAKNERKSQCYNESKIRFPHLKPYQLVLISEQTVPLERNRLMKFFMDHNEVSDSFRDYKRSHLQRSETETHFDFDATVTEAFQPVYAFRDGVRCSFDEARKMIFT